MDLPDPLITISPEYLWYARAGAGAVRLHRRRRPPRRVPGGFPDVTRAHAMAVLGMAQRAALAEVPKTFYSEHLT
jgi:hypothetical protein